MEMKALINAILALVFVLSLIGLVNFILKKYGPDKIAFAFSKLKKNQQKRLKLIEIMPLDARRRVVLFSRDGEEHLVLIGMNGETVIEKNIGSKIKSKSK